MTVQPTDSWDALLDRFPRAAPDLLIARELRSRADSKFVMSPAAAATLLRVLPPAYAVVAAGPVLVASYRTRYFDTAALAFFHAQRCDRRIRHKVRVRHYLDRRVSVLEVKMRRGPLETSKVVRARDYGDEALRGDDHAFIARYTGIAGTAVPQVSTDYRRITLLGLTTHERITIDLDLSVALGQHAQSLAAVVVVEVKQSPFSRHTPVMAALRRAGLRPSAVSKYCAAIVLMRPDVRHNRLLPGLRVLQRGAA